MGHFSGYFEGASTFLTLKIVPRCARDNLEVCPQKKIISRIFKISGALIVKNDKQMVSSTIWQIFLHFSKPNVCQCPSKQFLSRYSKLRTTVWEKFST
jgi:hypothetical protein